MHDPAKISMFLSEEEVQEFTGYKRAGDQKQWLDQQGYSFTINAIGKVIMLRAYIEKILGVEPISTPRKARPKEPNWAAINEKIVRKK
jgi:hypothetical protein